MTFSATDLISIVESAYRLEGTTTDWLSRVTETVRPHVDQGMGTIGYLYRLTRDPRSRSSHIVVVGGFDGMREEVRALHRSAPPELFLRSHAARFHLGAVSQRIDLERADPLSTALREMNAGDVLGLKTLDTNGRGLMICSPLVRRRTIGARENTRWGLVAAHLDAGLRLRHRSRAGRADAVVTPGGRVIDATGEAEGSDARARLRRAVLDIERARTRRVRSDPEEALALWRGLVDGRWSLVETFERDGRRFLVAHRNAPSVRDPRALSPPERSVLAYAALGHSNKLIAYTLGSRPTTVATHLSSARRKLGFRTRAELLAFVAPFVVASGPRRGRE